MTTDTLDTEAEREALMADAQLRRREALAVLRRLWPDRATDDAVLQEVVAMLDALRQAEQAIREATR